MDILANVINQKVKISSNLQDIVAGTEDFIRFIFSFDNGWTNADIYVRFVQNENVYDVLLDTNNSVYVPPEITQGVCTLSLYGSHDNTIATTNYLTLFIDENGLIRNANSTEITQSLYNQLVNKVDSFIKENITTYYKSVVLEYIPTEDTTNIPIVDTDFRYDIDLLDVYINGGHLIENVDFIRNEYSITLINPAHSGDEINFMIRRTATINVEDYDRLKGEKGDKGDKGDSGATIDVEDNLNSTSTVNALSANQGRILNNKFVEKETGKGLSSNDYTNAEKTKLAGIEDGANNYVLPQATNYVMGGTKLYALLGSNTDGTINQKIITDNLNTKVDKVSGKQLSTEDYTTAEKTKLAGIEDGANKVIVENILTSTNIDTALSANQGRILNVNKLDKTGNGSNVITNFTRASTRINLTSGETLATSMGKISKYLYDLKPVAFSGSYNDLSNKPEVIYNLQSESVSNSNIPSSKAAKDYVDALIMGVFRPAGNRAFSDLPSVLGESILGCVYGVTDTFVTDSRFVEGAGHTYPAGTNIVVVDIGTPGNPIYKFDTMSGFIDLSMYYDMDTLKSFSETQMTELYTTGNITSSTLNYLNRENLISLWSKTNQEFVAKEEGKGLTTNDFTNEEKNKLANIEEYANYYVLPQATNSILGGVKLYTETGQNTNGTMTQKTITNELGSRLKQYSLIPSASSTYENSIIQYTGTDTTNYKNGHFYKCVTNGTTYSWIEVQFGGEVGKIYYEGTIAEGEIFNDYENNVASEEYSHAEGLHTQATEIASHSEGGYNIASGEGSHAEGGYTQAAGNVSHSEGYYTQANGFASHTSGSYTISGYDNQVVIGAFNDNQSESIFEIGNGTDDDNRSNALTVDTSGNLNIAGTINNTAIPQATNTNRGGMTLYSTTGASTTGTMTQKAISDAINQYPYRCYFYALENQSIPAGVDAHSVYDFTTLPEGAYFLDLSAHLITIATRGDYTAQIRGSVNSLDGTSILTNRVAWNGAYTIIHGSGIFSLSGTTTIYFAVGSTVACTGHLYSTIWKLR